MIPTFIQNVPEYSVWSYFVKEIGLPIFLYKKPHKENYFSPLQPKLPFLIQKRFQKPSLIICKCSKRLFEHITALILIIFSKKQEFCVNLHVTYKLLRFPKIVLEVVVSLSCFALLKNALSSSKTEGLVGSQGLKRTK